MNISRVNRRPAAFTLVELLVVIAIIGILAAILIPTLAGAMRNAQEGAILNEMNQMVMAMEDYKLKNGGSYPPDFTTGFGLTGNKIQQGQQGTGGTSASQGWNARMGAHANRISNKRHRNDATEFSNGIDVDTDPSNGIQPTITPDEALVFWLRMTRTNVEYPFTGDAIYDNPFYTAGSDPNAAGTAPDPDPNGPGMAPEPGYFEDIKDQCRVYFEFDERRLVDFDNDGYLSYVPPYGPKVPYVYFHNSTYLTAKLNSQDLRPFEAPNPTIPSSGGIARPYASAIDTAAGSLDVVDFYQQEGFQIIAPGFDGEYGPSGEPDYATFSGTGVVTITLNSPETDPNNIKWVSQDQNKSPNNNFRKEARDNFASFLNGRVDKVMDN